MCAVAPVGDAGLLVVGGATKNGEFSDRAYVLDTKSYEWTELDAPNGPTARGSACCAALDASQVQCINQLVATRYVSRRWRGGVLASTAACTRLTD